MKKKKKRKSQNLETIEEAAPKLKRKLKPSKMTSTPKKKTGCLLTVNEFKMKRLAESFS